MTLKQFGEAHPEVQDDLALMRTLVNTDSNLQSLLYDLDLLPEQINFEDDCFRFMSVCIHWTKRWTLKEKT